MLISRSLVAIYSDPFLKERLAFRGGTALHKLQFFPQVRYMLFSVGYVPTVSQFDENMAAKLSMPEFLDDTVNYLRNGIEFDPVESWAMLRAELIDGRLESKAV